MYAWSLTLCLYFLVLLQFLRNWTKSCGFQFNVGTEEHNQIPMLVQQALHWLGYHWALRASFSCWLSLKTTPSLTAHWLPVDCILLHSWTSQKQNVCFLHVSGPSSLIMPSALMTVGMGSPHAKTPVVKGLAWACVQILGHLSPISRFITSVTITKSLFQVMLCSLSPLKS